MPTFILARFYRLEYETQQAILMAKIALETGASIPSKPTRGKLPGDERALRGIPAIGRNVTGAIPGTTPGSNLK